MKILFYSHFFKPETGAASVRAEYYVRALEESGYEVLIVAPKPNYPKGKIFEGYNNKLVIQENNVVYLPISGVNSHSPVGRLISYLSYSISSFLYLLFSNFKPDIVISSSPPIFTSLAALIYAKIKKAQFLFDVRDIWPDIGIELGILKNCFFILGLRKIEKYLLNNSGSIFVTADGDKRNIESKVGHNKNIKIIYNGADTELFQPISANDKTSIRKKYNIPSDKIVVVYFGSYNHGMNDTEMLSEFLLNDRIVNKNIHFLSIGSGDNLNNIIERIKGKISYTALDSLPLNKVAKLVASADISIIPRKGIKKDTGGNIPVKCFESWAAGVPVLLSNINDSEVSDIFNSCKAGILVEVNNSEALINGYEELMKLDLQELGVMGREYVRENFDRKKQSEKLVEILGNYRN
jgi:glycosyltransferase involved in cell wall biosynthesis